MKKLLFIFLCVATLGGTASVAQELIHHNAHGPDYSSLSSYEGRWSDEGLVTNTTNSYGIVDGSGNVTTLKSILPGPTGRDLVSNGTAPTLTSGNLTFGGAGRLRHSGASTWNFAHFNATPANLKWTVHIVTKVGTGSDPNAFYGLVGNNGSSGGNKGFSIYFDDRVAGPRNNAIRCQITQGGGNFTFNNTQDNVITPNELCVITVETEIGTTPNSGKQRVWINGRLQSIQVVYTTVGLITTPTLDLEIGGSGNGAGPLVGIIKECIIQSTIETGQVRSAFTQGLMYKYGIYETVFLAEPDPTRTFDIFNTYQAAVGDYYLACSFDQHPIFPYRGVRVFADGTDHTAELTKKASVQKFTNYGQSFATKTVLYDPVGSLAVQDLGGGYANSGRHFTFMDIHTASGGASTSPHYAFMSYTDDDYDSQTLVDITSLLPSDGLDTWRFYGNLIENNGYLMFPFYKLDDEGDTNPSAIYLLRIASTLDPSILGNWAVHTIYAPTASPYLNETTIIALNDNTILALARNDVTFEYTQFISTDNGVNWTNQGDCSFGETLAFAGPCRLNTFSLAGTKVIVCYYPDRNAPSLKAVYAKASDIIASGVSGWNLSTKTTLLSGTGRRLHYGDYFHPNGNFNAIGMSAYEKSPLDLSNNDLVTFVVLSTHYATVKTALGL